VFKLIFNLYEYKNLVDDQWPIGSHLDGAGVRLRPGVELFGEGAPFALANTLIEI
jgi:hypothetical protein